MHYTRLNIPKSNLEYAIHYSELNWPVFPCNRDKSPRTARGFKDATTNRQKIDTWWRINPFAGIGIATGQKSGLFVLDVDRKGGGLESLNWLIAEHGHLISDKRFLIVSRTGGAGLHYLFKRPRGDSWKSCAGLWPGIDIRCDGGYIIAPPSEHPSGKRYKWATEPHHEMRLTFPPQWILTRLAARDIQARPEPKPLRAIPSNGDPIGAFNAAYDAAAVLESHGYTRVGNRRYRRPDSDSGMPGVVVNEDGRVFSFGNDALNDGAPKDAFDCYRLLEHSGDYTAAVRAAAELTKGARNV